MQNTGYDTRPSSMNGVGRFLEGPAAWIVTFVALPILVIAVLLLPPVRLLDRLQAFTYTRISTAGGAIRDDDGTTVNFPAEGLTAAVMASIDSTPRPEFIEGQAGKDLYEAAKNVPDYLIPKSPYYAVKLLGDPPAQVVLTIPIPNDSLPYETLGLYSWNGTSWEHIASEVLATDDVIEARLEFMPPSFMVMQTAPAVPAVTADLGSDGQLPEGAFVANEAKAGLYLRGDGALEGTAPVNSGSTLPVIRNWQEDVVRTDLINNLYRSIRACRRTSLPRLSKRSSKMAIPV